MNKTISNSVKMVMHYISTVVLSLIILLGTSAGAKAAEADAKRILKTMSDYMGAQKSISFGFDATLEVVTTDEQKLALASSGTLTLNRPDRIRVTRSGGFADVEMSFDGKTLTLLGKNLNLYTQLDVPGTIDHLVDEFKDTYNRPLPAEFDPKDVEQRMQIHFEDFTLVRTGKDFTSKEEFVKDRQASPGDAVVVHFLREDDNPHDASLLDMSVLYPGTAICTDSVTWVDANGNWYEGKDWPLPEGLQSHPRAAGNYCRFLRKWVRERGVLSWMDAIRQASLNSCLILQDYAPALKTKGRIQEAMDADIIVFDPETVTDKATFKEPCQLSEGMKHVMVNGTFLIRDAELDPQVMPGKQVRGPIRG